MTTGVQISRTSGKDRHSSSGICNPSTPLERQREKETAESLAAHGQLAWKNQRPGDPTLRWKVRTDIHKVLLRRPRDNPCVCLHMCMFVQWVSHIKDEFHGERMKKKRRKVHLPQQVVCLSGKHEYLNSSPRIYIRKKIGGHGCLFVISVLERGRQMDSQCSRTSQLSLLDNLRAMIGPVKKKWTAPQVDLWLPHSCIHLPRHPHKHVHWHTQAQVHTPKDIPYRHQ